VREPSPLHPAAKPKLMFFVTEDWYFCSHRLPLAVAAREAGFDVAVATRVNRHAEAIEAAGLRLIPLNLSRGGKNPLSEWRAIVRLYRVLRQEQPDILHNVAMKPVLYGSLAARLAGTPHVVNAFAGLGHIFADEERAGWLRQFVKLAFRWLLKGHGQVIVQNPDDLRLLRQSGAITPNQVTLIRGSGVDLARFQPSPEPDGIPVAVLAARLLWDKGVGEFAAAAESLQTAGVRARFVIVGEPDPENHSSIQAEQLAAWRDSGFVECWGKRTDMPSVLAASHIVCLPSYYGEGVPKILLEAAAAGRPIVTTDMPGCREVVTDGENGLLVPARDVPALAAALRALLEDSALRQRMGECGRRRAEVAFGVEQVIAQTLAIYRELLTV
jgi:glycosyltransferase involved in cell wall biosynthesis